MYAPSGFTETSEVRAILAQREPTILYGMFPNDGKNGGTVTFDGLTLEEAERLLELLPPEQAKDSQNGSPTFAEFVALGRKHPGMTFHGYRVVSRRSDERITIEGFYLYELSREDELELSGLGADECEWSTDHSGRAAFRTWWD